MPWSQNIHKNVRKYLILVDIDTWYIPLMSDAYGDTRMNPR